MCSTSFTCFLVKDIPQMFKNLTSLILFSLLNDLIFQFKMLFNFFLMLFDSVLKNTQVK